VRKTMIVIAATLALGGISASFASDREGGDDRRRRAAFDFALIGDMPYRPADEAKLDRVIADINGEKRLPFTVHVGDIKSGSSRCDDAVYQRELARMETVGEALVYTPGDNEWTDCHRPAAGAFDPLERLAYLRSVFFAEPDTSLGHDEIAVEFQSADYPENARWSRGKVTFATLHVVGSNNNRIAPTNPVGNDTEYAARNAATVEWLRQTFDRAAAGKAIGLVLAVQANMFEDNVHDPSGFDELIDELRAEVIEFGRPVVLVHGDSHYFRIDKPLLDPAGVRLANFTRVEVFGDRDVHWVRGTVDPGDEEIFSFEAEIIEANV
jgi:hypothetical protein